MEENKSLKFKRIISLISISVIVISFAVCYFVFGKNIIKIFDKPEIFKTWLNKFGKWDEIIFISIRAFQTVIKIIPAEPLEIGSGYAYGTWGGLLYCMIGTEIGSLIILLLTKIFGTKIINLFIPQENIEKLKFLQNKQKIMVTLFFIYLIPGTPKDLITYFSGKLKLNIPLFLLVTGIARVPSIITSTWCGAALGEKNIALAAVVFISTLIISVFGMIIYKKIFESKK